MFQFYTLKVVLTPKTASTLVHSHRYSILCCIWINLESLIDANSGYVSWMYRKQLSIKRFKRFHFSPTLSRSLFRAFWCNSTFDGNLTASFLSIALRFAFPSLYDYALELWPADSRFNFQQFTRLQHWCVVQTNRFGDWSFTESLKFFAELKSFFFLERNVRLIVFSRRSP